MNAEKTGGPGDLWHGIHKLTEEMGELLCELGKVGAFPRGDHPDGKGPMKERIEKEVADVLAACDYFIEVNKLNMREIADREVRKLDLYKKWGLTGLAPVQEEKPYSSKDGQTPEAPGYVTFPVTLPAEQLAFVKAVAAAAHIHPESVIATLLAASVISGTKPPRDVCRCPESAPDELLAICTRCGKEIS